MDCLFVPEQLECMLHLGRWVARLPRLSAGVRRCPPSYVGVVMQLDTQTPFIDRLSAVRWSWRRVVHPLAFRLGRLGPGDVGVLLHGRALGRFVTFPLGLGGCVRVQRLVVIRGSGLHGGPPLLAQLLCSSLGRSQGERTGEASSSMDPEIEHVLEFVHATV